MCRRLSLTLGKKMIARFTLWFLFRLTAFIINNHINLLLIIKSMMQHLEKKPIHIIFLVWTFDVLKLLPVHVNLHISSKLELIFLMSYSSIVLPSRWKNFRVTSFSCSVFLPGCPMFYGCFVLWEELCGC